MFLEVEPNLNISSMDQVYIIEQALIRSSTQYFRLVSVNWTTLLETRENKAPMVTTGAKMGPHNFSYGAFVVNEYHEISAARVSNAVPASGTV